jgi:hypothetical protein
MLTAEQFRTLKKMNASKDQEKSRERIDSDYKATSKKQKDELEALSGLSANSFYNAGKSGGASPKVVLALAQVLGVSPFYYTGKTDEKEPLTDKLINQFLLEIGANAPVKAKRGYDHKTAPKPAEKGAARKSEKLSKADKAEKAAKAVKSATKKAAEKTKRTVGKIKTTAGAVAEKAAPVVEKIAVPKASVSKSKAASDLSKDDIITLVSALHIRSGLSAEAKKKLDGIKAILLS